MMSKYSNLKWFAPKYYWGIIVQFSFQYGFYNIITHSSLLKQNVTKLSNISLFIIWKIKIEITYIDDDRIKFYSHASERTWSTLLSKFYEAMQRSMNSIFRQRFLDLITITTNTPRKMFLSHVPHVHFIFVAFLSFFFIF